ncbi:PTS lactose/cellobiose transporter subunit IIA [Helicovermis profundi]|uniref:PTS lichenan transporter subunit IIA n=1 Tax=Helicovermis profundi TaxID=3065157 RepID=A0AAU9EAC0_9FIRM|nr:PTS lichenan transporter subunit IIA [Clostridia bacterium S502]
MNLEMIIFQIITHSGDAKSSLFEAIAFAKKNDFKNAEIKINEAESKIVLAHNEQTKLIQNEASGKTTEISLLMVHAQDHLMNTLMFKDIAKEFIELYKKIEEK